MLTVLSPARPSGRRSPCAVRLAARFSPASMAGFAALTMALAMSAAPAASASTPSGFVPIDTEGIASIDASSTLSAEGATYPAAYLIDGRNGRPWLSAARVDGPVIDVSFQSRRWISHVGIMPGHGRDNRLFKSNRRPTTIELRYNGHSQRIYVEDSRRFQRIRLQELVVTEQLSLHIVEYSGPSAAPLAIGELSFYEPRDMVRADPELASRIDGALDALADPERRSWATSALRSYGRYAVGPLLRVVGDRDNPARAQALEIVFATRGGAASAAANQLLDSGVRANIILALSAMGDSPVADIRPALARLSRVDDLTIRSLALPLSVRSGDKSALEVVSAWVEAGRLVDSSERASSQAGLASAVAALHHLGREGLATARRLSGDVDPQLRRMAATALGGFTGTSSRNLLKRAADDEVSAVRVAALAAFGNRRELQSLPLLIARATQGADDEAGAAALALIALGGDAHRAIRNNFLALDNVAGALLVAQIGRDANPSNASLLADLYLSQFGHPLYPAIVDGLEGQGSVGIDALLELARQSPRRVRRAGRFLVAHAQEASEPTAKMLTALADRRGNHYFKGMALDVLAATGDRRYRGLVQQVFDGETVSSGTVRRKALGALARLGAHPTSIRTITECVMDRDSDYFWLSGYAAAATLGVRGLAPTIRARLAATPAAQWEVEAVEALARLGGEEALAFLIDGYPITGRRAQLAILRAANQANSAQGVAVLIDAAVSRDDEVRDYATTVLVDETLRAGP